MEKSIYLNTEYYFFIIIFLNVHLFRKVQVLIYP